MTYARKSLICLAETPYYHVVGRCVRRAWLWGVDPYAGKDYSHRKAWVLERLTQLARMFAIDICAYAVMSNHYHLVLRVDQRRANAWTTDEVLDRWDMLFTLPPPVERFRAGTATTAERQLTMTLIERWRQRLAEVSWYMRCLNEHLARRANAEDQCTGRFWEGRFKSQALLDEAGLLTAMSYVDLNPLRAGIAETPEASEFASIYARIRELRPESKEHPRATSPTPGVPLLAFQDRAAEDQPAIPFAFEDYLTLVDWSGRRHRSDKAGAIDDHLPPILTRLHIDAAAWRQVMQPDGNVFGRALGTLERMRLHAAALGQSWVKGLGQARRLYQ